MTDELHVEYVPQIRQYVKTLTKLADVTFYKWKQSVLIVIWTLNSL